MKVFLFHIMIVFTFSCNAQAYSFDTPIEDPQQILKDQTAYINYCDTYLKLSEDFIAYDEELKEIPKGKFLLRVLAGGYLPLKLVSKDTARYKLYKTNLPQDDYISISIRSLASIENNYFLMEGKPLPKFDFVDLDGNIYNPETTNDKIVVLKFWFIRCGKCIEEMPDLNKLVNRYKGRKDIVFISLAFDTKEPLVQFLKKVKFKYPVIPNQYDYMVNDLKFSLYPTHIIINKKGVIVKVVSSFIEMLPILEKEALKF